MPMRVAFCCLLVGLSLIAGATASVLQAAESCDAPGLSQAELNECFGNAYKEADAELNVFYRQITARLKDDKATTELLVAAEGVGGVPRRRVRFLCVRGFGGQRPWH